VAPAQRWPPDMCRLPRAPTSVGRSASRHHSAVWWDSKRRSAALLQAAGATVVEVELPWTTDAIYTAAQAHFGTIFGPSVGAELAENANLLTTYPRAFAQDLSSTLGFVEGLALEGQIYRPLGELLNEFDALICPTMGSRGFPVGEDYVGTTCTVDGVPLANYSSARSHIRSTSPAAAP